MTEEVDDRAPNDPLHVIGEDPTVIALLAALHRVHVAITTPIEPGPVAIRPGNAAERSAALTEDPKTEWIEVLTMRCTWASVDGRRQRFAQKRVTLSRD